jgi:hypothetical protein
MTWYTTTRPRGTHDPIPTWCFEDLEQSVGRHRLLPSSPLLGLQQPHEVRSLIKFSRFNRPKLRGRSSMLLAAWREISCTPGGTHSRRSVLLVCEWVSESECIGI